MPVILFLNKEENYYLQVKKKIDFKKKKKVTRHITDNLEISSDDSNESDEE